MRFCIMDQPFKVWLKEGTVLGNCNFVFFFYQSPLSLVSKNTIQSEDVPLVDNMC